MTQLNAYGTHFDTPWNRTQEETTDVEQRVLRCRLRTRIPVPGSCCAALVSAPREGRRRFRRLARNTGRRYLRVEGRNSRGLLQTKHHRNSEASLSNASGDLWKTLRVWFEGHANKHIPAGTALCLLTTSAAPKDSAAWFLRKEDRDVVQALSILESTAQSSKAKPTPPRMRRSSLCLRLRAEISSTAWSCWIVLPAF